MLKKWIVVADRAGALIFASVPGAQKLELVATLEHPDGRLRNHDLDADAPGRSHDRHGAGRHSVEPQQSATRHDSAKFAHEVSERLETARVQSRFDQLILIAPPRFLGELRAVLSDPTRGLVSHSVAKELANLPRAELVSTLENFVSELDATR
ncbi:MAG: host attachment protein [Planctomycetota bacterium]